MSPGRSGMEVIVGIVCLLWVTTQSGGYLGFLGAILCGVLFTRDLLTPLKLVPYH